MVDFEGVRPIFSELSYIADFPFKPKNAPDPRRVNGYAAKTVDEQSDAPKSASGAFFQVKDHRADWVISGVLSLNSSGF